MQYTLQTRNNLIPDRHIGTWKCPYGFLIKSWMLKQGEKDMKNSNRNNTAVDCRNMQYERWYGWDKLSFIYHNAVFYLRSLGSWKCKLVYLDTEHSSLKKFLRIYWKPEASRSEIPLTPSKIYNLYYLAYYNLQTSVECYSSSVYSFVFCKCQQGHEIILKRKVCPDKELISSTIS